MHKYKQNIFVSFGTVLLFAFLIPLFATPNISEATTTVLLHDLFTTPSTNTSLWHIPTWTGNGDGTYIGRTQLRVTQNSGLPTATNGVLKVPVQTYNPIQGVSFYGTDLISNQTFSVAAKQGLDIKVRAKINAPRQPGTVGGIFLYALKPGSNTLHDEIDFELLGNRLNQVQTNIYANEPLGAGHSSFIQYPTGSSTTYHIYEMKWFTNKVQWLIDGTLVRTDTTHVPTGPMGFHLNEWVPDAGWAEAYNANLQPTATASLNKIYSTAVDYVNIQTIDLP